MKKIFTALAMTVVSAVVVTFSFNAAAIAAIPGALDPSFGIGGKVFTPVPGDSDQAERVAVQADGKILVAGGSNAGDFIVVRYAANGALDTTFGGDGIVTTDFGSPDEIIQDIAIQSDGKIIVVGRLFNGGAFNGSGIARYLPDGSLDTTFDADGKLIISQNGFSAKGLAIQADGKIIIAGSGFFGSDAVVVRLNLNGSFDTTFDSDGTVVTNVEGGDDFNDVKLQTDGKIVAAGESASGNKSLVVRYNTNGSLDTSFSGDGIALNDFNTGSVTTESTESLVIDPITSTITTIGSVFTPIKINIVRYTSFGSLDISFNGNGRVEISLFPEVTGKDVVLQPDGKVLILSSLATNFSLIRLSANGFFDTTFGNNGVVSFRAGGDFSATSMALFGDKLLVATSGNDFETLRYNLSISPSQTGDFDGDGFTDSTVYRPSTATWFTLRSSNNTVTQEQFGLNGDIPMDGDFDGDGRADLAIFRPSSGIWFFKRSSNGATLGAQFGQSTDKPQSGDFDKDGKSDIGLWRPSNGNWFVLRSSDNFASFFAYPFGTNGDIPVQTGAQ